MLAEQAAGMCVKETERGESSMTLTKAHIVENLFAKNLFTKSECAQIVETLFEVIKQTLEQGEDVLVSGFGKFSVKEKNQSELPFTGACSHSHELGCYVGVVRGAGEEHRRSSPSWHRHP